LSISLYDDFYVTVEVVVKLYEQVHGKVASWWPSGPAKKLEF
jgi:hypothetical protein